MTGWWWFAWLCVAAGWVLIVWRIVEGVDRRSQGEPWLPDDDDRRRWRP